ncbi:MAG: hypothetical protein WCO26_19240, partial [Deltaproteobacteria bacterium]
MAVYNYPVPCAPRYKKPANFEDCLPQARRLAKKQHGRVAMGPVRKGDKLLIVTYPDQDPYVKEAIVEALKEQGADKVDFMSEHEISGKEPKVRSVKDGWAEAERMAKARPDVGELPHILELGDVTEAGDSFPKYLDEHPDYTGVFWGLGGRIQLVFALGRNADKFRNNWMFNNWEEFISNAWTYPDELEVEIERKIIESLGRASQVRITDPEGTHLEYSVSEEEALRW